MRAMDIAKFSIGFDHRDRGRLHALWDSALNTEQWSDGPLTRPVRASLVRVERIAVGRHLELDRRRARGARVLRGPGAHRALPVEHVHGDAAGDPGRRRAGRVRRLQPRTISACRSRTSSARRARTGRKPSSSCTSAATSRSTSSGSPSTAAVEGILLLEDCAHAHGASWNGRRAGTWGDAGVWSFAATKTISTGEGGMLVSRHAELIEFARRFRSYGKPDYDQPGLELPPERVHGRARHRRRRAPRRDHGMEEHRRARPARPEQHPNRVRAARGNGLRATTSTSSSTRSSARPGRSTTSPAIGCSAITSTCRTPTGSRRTTGACRSTTSPLLSRSVEVVAT